jgi:hypothetical protein
MTFAAPTNETGIAAIHFLTQGATHQPDEIYPRKKLHLKNSFFCFFIKYMQLIRIE